MVQLEKIGWDLLRGKGSRNANEMQRIISERNLDTDEELCACCIDWQNTTDRNQPKGNQNVLTRKNIE
jgi:hypothetical protein